MLRNLGMCGFFLLVLFTHGGGEGRAGMLAESLN